MKLIFLSKRREVDDVYYFGFQPAEHVAWLAGQSIRLEIDGEERRFSIVSAPYEKNIAIATRISDSDFKQALMALHPKTEIDGFNIEGKFLWDETASKRILFASGVGITAYYPMLKQLAYEKQPLNATLVYANRDDQFLFGDELKRLQTKHPELSLEFLPGQRLSQKIIEKYRVELSQSLVYLSGPEAMVNEISPLLISAGVKENLLKRDIFTGRMGWGG